MSSSSTLRPLRELWDILGWKGPTGIRELLLPSRGVPAVLTWFFRRFFGMKGGPGALGPFCGDFGLHPLVLSAREQRGIHSLLGLQFVEDSSDFR
ncbi:hypothetical protein HGM15179_001882, partial [Zosterops borbonicus]